MQRTISNLRTMFALMVAAGTMDAQAQIVSPEVHPDRTVTFRLKDPGAMKVVLALEGKAAAAMSKDNAGVWTVTTEPLRPDLYGYSFVADGVSLLDPSNYLMKPNLIWQGNMVLVPGSPPEPWEVQDVPHGELHRHFYRSAVIGDQRDYYVYTPPGYRQGDRKTYPVLYLLHGFSDMASGWTAVGQAHTIMDNLIAAGRTKPMIVVMPLGYGVSDFVHTSNFRDDALVKRNYDNYRDALFSEVIPQVEKEYRASRERADRAIAGLSMGGAESLYIGLNNLDRFAYVGAFSSGGLSPEFGADFPNLNPANVNSKLKKLWISCGTEDFLIAFNRQLKSWLTDKGVKFEAVETSGQHEWPVWRRNLATFTGLLFR